MSDFVISVMANQLVPYARAARAHLTRADPVLAAIIAEVGPCRIALRPEHFPALARAIIFQQLAGRAAQAIHDRFVALYPEGAFPTPARVMATTDALMRTAGLSAKKALYLKDLAHHVENRLLNFHLFSTMKDEEIIADLIRVKGIGRWTAEMFLMFNLGRPDVLPVDDLGFQSAVMKAYRLRKRPDAKRLRQIAERWKPYRSAAVWYMWQSTRIILPDGAPRAVKAAARKAAATAAHIKSK